MQHINVRNCQFNTFHNDFQRDLEARKIDGKSVVQIASLLTSANSFEVLIYRTCLFTL